MISELVKKLVNRLYSIAPEACNNDGTNFELRLFDIQTYTELTLNEEYVYSKHIFQRK